MRIFIVAFLLCSGLFSKAQQQTIDSLNQLLLQHPQQDSIHLNLLNKISESYTSVDTEKGAEMADKAITLGQQLHLPAKLAEAMLAKADNLLSKKAVGPSKMAVGYLYKAREIFEKIKDIDHLIKVQIKIIDILQMLRDYDTTEAEAILGSNFCDKYNRPKDKLKFLYSAGRANLYKAQFSVALVYFQQIQELAVDAGDKKLLSNAYLGQGIVYASMQERQKAIDQYKKALGIYETMGYKEGIASALNNIATLYTEMSAYKESISFLERAAKLNEELGNKPNLRFNLHNLAYAYQSQNDFGKAIEYRKKMLTLLDKTEDEAALEEMLVELSNLYSHAPDSVLLANDIPPQAKYKQAINANLRFINFKRNNGNSLISVRQSYMELSMLYEKDRDFGNALKEFKNYIGVRDSIIDVDKQKELTRIDMNYAFSKKEDSLNMRQQITNGQLQRQTLLATQQRQALQLASKEKDLQRLAYLNQQAQLESEKTGRQNEEARAKYNAAIKNEQIDKQEARIKADKKFKGVLGGIILLALSIAGLFWYSQQRTSRLNKKIILQSSELSIQKQQLELQKDELQEVNGVKDRLFSVISHDLRTPVNSLLTLSMMLGKSNISPEKMDQYTGMLQKDLGHTAGLLENLLNFAKSQMGGYKPHMETFSIGDVVTDTIPLLQPTAAAKQITIENNSDPNAMVHADASMTALIIRNLVGNAIKYSEPGGGVTLSTQYQNGQLRLLLKDSGTGMDDSLVQVFNDASNTTALDSNPGTRDEKGTGLGLMLCKNFAALMGGKLWVESELGKGSCFSLELSTEPMLPRDIY